MINISFWNILFTVVNLLILFVAFKIFFFKPVKAIIDKRQAEADEAFAKAADQEQKADQTRKEFEEKLASAETEKKQILSAARKQADGESQKILADAKEEARKIQTSAVAQAEHEKQEILDSAKSEIARMVVDAASKVVGEKTGADVDSKLFDRFIDKAGDSK